MDALSDAELELWHAWKLATETVLPRIMEDVGAATGLSGPDFAVVTRVAELGGGTMRQNELAASMGWHRSRLSHQLTRMEQRGLLSRTTSGTGVQVTLSENGRAAVAAARPVHARAVREHLVELVPATHRAEFGQTLRRLSES